MPRPLIRVLQQALTPLGLIGLAAMPAWAEWPHSPDAGNVPICQVPGDQQEMRIAPDGSGGAIFVWSDARSGTSLDLYAQRVDRTGAVRWAAGGVPVCTAPGDQRAPVVTSDGSGGVVVAWEDRRGGGRDIYAQRLDAAGATLWTTNGVPACSAAGDQALPTLASDGAGGAIVCWDDARPSNADPDLYAQRLDASGTAHWSADGVVVCNAAGAQEIHEMVSDQAGGIIVVWVDPRLGTPNLFAQRLDSSGAPVWVSNGIVVCSAFGGQSFPDAVSDGSGGAIFAWQDNRVGQPDIYAQRVNTAGVLLWPPNGAAICLESGEQSVVSVDSDGSGGAVFAWQDRRLPTQPLNIYSQRVNAGGGTLWTLNGVPACLASGAQTNPQILAGVDGSASLVWTDGRTGVNDIYSSRISPSGAISQAQDGIPVCTEALAQDSPQLCADGAGGVIVGWQDARGGAGLDLYAQRIDTYGYLGNPEPRITGVGDVLNDEGGAVKVSWSRSYLDADALGTVFEYRLWRSAPANRSAAAGAPDLVSNDPDVAAGQGIRYQGQGAAADYTWELVGSQIANGLAAYSRVTATTSDSTAHGNPLTVFMVEARRESASPIHWFSAPDSGYSVDNLAPAAPAPFTARYSAGAVHLHWEPNGEADLAGYRLHRGVSPDFSSGSANLVAALVDTGYADPGVLGSVWYKLVAVDVHGNASAAALLGPLGPGSPSTVLALAGPWPNPGRAQDSEFRFSLPRAGSATLTLFDQQGRRVRELVRGEQPAGEQDVRWDGRDEGGHGVPPGVYFARLEAAGQALRARFVVVQ